MTKKEMVNAMVESLNNIRGKKLSQNIINTMLKQPKQVIERAWNGYCDNKIHLFEAVAILGKAIIK